MSGLNDYTERLKSGGSLGHIEARSLMDILVSGDADTNAIKELLLALNTKTRSVEEISGFAEGMREAGIRVAIRREPVVDTCGTGGDGLQTFNISTTAAFVTAGAGVAVAKHGNRSVSSKCGSADVLEALGVAIDATPFEVRASIEEVGFGFFFAPKFHPAMKHVGAARRELGVRTVFNLLGPLGNPARVRRQVVGIYDGALLETYARVLLRLGAERVLVVRGEDGMDEFSLSAPTRVCHVDADRGIWQETVEPEDAGLKSCAPMDLAGGDAVHNARLLEEILGGAPGPRLDATLYNAAGALIAAGVAKNYKEGVALARISVSSGKARGVLDDLRRRQEAQE